jgi:hypothetical protein
MKRKTKSEMTDLERVADDYIRELVAEFLELLDEVFALGLCADARYVVSLSRTT